jgi:2-polyprenyl-3-methyl-5-hydroxy-6-metoxy-1,4-benzoquinol methylase
MVFWVVHKRATVTTREPLEQSAPLARRWAASLCKADPLSGESCAWNHGIWQYLRLLGVAGDPAEQADFFRASFDRIPARRRPLRVLISGTADYGMLAQVVRAFGARSLEPEITVVDLCETPLALNRWYAQREGKKIETWCGDVREFQPELLFDVVCTHFLLGRFAPGERIAVIEKWKSLLRPGGLVVTANRLRPSGGAAPSRYSAERVLEFGDTVTRRAQALATALDIGAELLGREALDYASRYQSWPVRSGEEIRDLFAHAGLAVETLTVVPYRTPNRHDDAQSKQVAASVACIAATRV